MEWNQYRCFMILALSFCLLLFTQGLSAATFISDGIFESQHSTGRSLLQAKKPCPVNFEFQNYTIITSQCKGPTYPAKICCGAFKEFACPFAEQVNDLTNDCASTMFSYINLYGKYPPGLFANECKEGKEGLACPAPSPSQLADSKNNQMMCNPSPVLMLAAGSRDGILKVQALTGRNILQIKKDCPVNFELQNYTILTSGCKGPPYQTQPCCDAMREFACPFADELNNSTYDCATPMLTYAELQGFPRGLFITLCHDTKDAWFLCSAIPPTTASPDDANYHHRLCNPSFQLMLTSSFLVLLLGF